MALEIAARERELLLELVDREVEELGPEIHHTTRAGFRHELEEKRRSLVDLRDRLAEAVREAQASV